MNTLKKLVKIFTNGILVILFVLLVIIIGAKAKIIFGNDKYFEMFGYSIFEVATGSMEPNIGKNDIIIVKKDNDYEVNDIVTFKSEGNYITHRIVDINDSVFITKGDANNTSDKPINRSEVIGRVIKIYTDLGIWKDIFSNPKIIMIVFITLLLFDIAFSYKINDNVVDSVSINDNNDEQNKLTKDEISEIKKKVETYDDDYTMRLDLSLIKKNINKKINKSIIIIIAVLVVIVRGYMGYGIPTSWNKTVVQNILFYIIMGLGKALGGILSDTYGPRKTAIFSTLLAIPFLSFGDNIMIISIIGVMCFSMTMAITLGILASCLPKTPGLAFGLTTIGLFLGTVPIFFYKITSTNLNIIMICILSIVCCTLLGKVLRKDKI